MKAYEYRHTVGFEETNVVGNVYFVNHLRWQGRCRELFLRDHAPGILNDLRATLRLVTTRCSCEYFEELHALDEVIVRMRLGQLTQNRMSLLFEYWINDGKSERLIARGEQDIASMEAKADGMAATPLPEDLRNALQPYLHQ